MLSDPALTSRPEDGRDIQLLVWRAGAPLRAVSSGPLGGGIGVRNWVLNATVPMSYRRDDPAAHLAALAGGLGLAGPGVGLLTGVDVAEVVAFLDGDYSYYPGQLLDVLAPILAGEADLVIGSRNLGRR